MSPDIFSFKDSEEKLKKLEEIARTLEKHPLTEQQLRKVQVTAAKFANEPETQHQITKEVKEAAAAASALLKEFDAIGAELQAADDKYDPEEKFYPIWRGYRQEYNKILRGSKTQASQLATYLKHFVDVIFPTVLDPSIPTAEKEKKLKDFNGKIEEHKKASGAVADDLSNLASDIEGFTGKFSSFAKDKVGEATAAIEQLKKDIAALNETLKAIQLAMIGIAAGSGIVLPLLALIPGVGPLIALAGLGVVITVEIGLGSAMIEINKQILRKEKEILDKEEEITKINHTREELEQLKDTRIKAVIGHLGTIQQVWETISDACVQISTWVDLGADERDMPDFLYSYHVEGTTVYGALIKALGEYAKIKSG